MRTVDQVCNARLLPKVHPGLHSIQIANSGKSNRGPESRRNRHGTAEKWGLECRQSDSFGHSSKTTVRNRRSLYDSSSWEEIDSIRGSVCRNTAQSLSGVSWQASQQQEVTHRRNLGASYVRLRLFRAQVPGQRNSLTADNQFSHNWPLIAYRAAFIARLFTAGSGISYLKPTFQPLCHTFLYLALDGFALWFGAQENKGLI